MVCWGCTGCKRAGAAACVRRCTSTLLLPQLTVCYGLITMGSRQSRQLLLLASAARETRLLLPEGVCDFARHCEGVVRTKLYQRRIWYVGGLARLFSVRTAAPASAGWRTDVLAEVAHPLPFTSCSPHIARLLPRTFTACRGICRRRRHRQRLTVSQSAAAPARRMADANAPAQQQPGEASPADAAAAAAAQDGAAPSAAAVAAAAHDAAGKPKKAGPKRKVAIHLAYLGAGYHVRAQRQPPADAPSPRTLVHAHMQQRRSPARTAPRRLAHCNAAQSTSPAPPPPSNRRACSATLATPRLRRSLRARWSRREQSRSRTQAAS